MKKFLNSILLSLVFISPIFSQAPANNEGQIFGRKLGDKISINNLIYTQLLPPLDRTEYATFSLEMRDQKGVWKSISYRDGFILGGEVNGGKKLQYMKYTSTFQPGKILLNGTADDPNKNSYQLYKINKEWQKLPFGLTKDRYEFDYDNWPGQDGAPFFDLDQNGIFTRSIDKPNPMGDEGLWFVANVPPKDDPLDDYNNHYSTPIGLELQKSVYAYNNFNVLRDVVFIKYLFVNKGIDTLTDFYFSQWNDADIGYQKDDFACCMPEMNLGIAFNGDSLDENYFEKTPPALGLLLLQGPKVPGSDSDSAFYLGKWLAGMRNLNASSFNVFITPPFNDPYLDYEIWDFNAIHGLSSYSGTPIIDPISKNSTKFMLEGNPVEKTGWFAIDTLYKRFRTDDLRVYLSSGPFTMAPGDSQEVAVALIVGQGSDNLQSVADVIEKAKVVQYFYKNYDAYATSETYQAPVPEYYSLSQNYPNPFNPSTKIDYELPVDGFVTLEVFNVVGEKVATLVNALQVKGNHSITFDAAGLSSGIYFYSISSLNYFKTKKMSLIK